MPTDVFNNPSNDYVNPGLSPCANAADEFDFKFLPRQEAGITSGASVIQTLNLSDIIIPITSWTSEKKYINSGEVVFVPGMTKGLTNRTQYFTIPIPDPSASQEFFFMLDISVNYYYNFRYYDRTINASSNYTLGIDIADAMNTNLGAVNAGFGMVYDTSKFTFQAGVAGYDFDVTKATLTLIDASLDICSPFHPVIDSSGNRVAQTYTLSERTSDAIPASKYPNGAMRGYILKTYFPTTAGESDKWFYMNNVKSPYTVYEAVDVSTYPSGDNVMYYDQFSKRIDVGLNGSGSSTVMSAAEYLDYINTYDLWEKVGDFRAHTTSVDPADSNITNLVGGFYIFNPHEFSIMVEYMLIN